MAETVAEEMAENITEEEAETEIISVKAAETDDVVKSQASPLLNTAKHRKFANVTCPCHHNKMDKNGS